MNIVVIDSCFLARESLKVLLQECLASSKVNIKEAVSCHQGLAAIEAPALVIMTARSCLIEAYSQLELLRALWPAAALILYDADPFSDPFTRERVLQKCLKLGLQGYFSPQTSVKALKRLLKQAFVNVPLKNLPASFPSANHQERPYLRAFGALSGREQEVLQLLNQDFSNSAIAARLCIGLRTVESHKNSIRQKFNIKTPYALIQPELAYLLHATPFPSTQHLFGKSRQA